MYAQYKKRHSTGVNLHPFTRCNSSLHVAKLECSNVLNVLKGPTSQLQYFITQCQF